MGKALVTNIFYVTVIIGQQHKIGIIKAISIDNIAIHMLMGKRCHVAGGGLKIALIGFGGGVCSERPLLPRS